MLFTFNQPGHEFFASTGDIRNLVNDLFRAELEKSDAPQQLLESHYRTCRRHSGLTTEGQFRDTSGQVDMPVGEEDIESRVGFSHNSLREFMVADALADYLKNGTHFDELSSLIVTDTVADFVFGIAESDAKLLDALPRSYADCVSTKMGEVLFKVIQAFMRKKPSHVQILGSPR